MALQLQFGWFRFLLVTLGWRSFGLSVRYLLLHNGHSQARSLSLSRFLRIEESRFAIDTRVSEVFPKGVFDVAGVIAHDVLPCLASFAKDRLSVIVREVANTLDRVGLFFFRSFLLLQLWCF
jgi:hypothetical protein